MSIFKRWSLLKETDEVPTSKPDLQVKPLKLEVKAKTLNDYIKETYLVKGWDPRYGEVIKLLSPQLPIKAPCDLEIFLKAIINAESGFNNKSYYKEPAPLNRNSIGFFQLSLSDAKNYGIKGMFNSEKDFENPIKNIYLAMVIMNRLQTKHPEYNVWEALGLYWSVCRWNRYTKWKGKTQSGVNRVLDYLENNGVRIK